MRNNKEKKPTTQKSEPSLPSDFTYEQAFKNRLKVPKAVLDEVDSKGMVCRWINFNEFRRAGGYHHNHWTPYKPETEPGSDELGGRDQGYLRRGDLILAVRTKELNEAHKRFKDQKNAAKRAYDKNAADQLRRSMPGVKVLEGYDDNK